MAKPEPIAYIWHKDYVNESDRYIPTTNRNVMVHLLIEAYGLLDNMMTVTPKKASIQDLAAFHSMDYLNFLSNPNSNRDEDSINDENDDYGLEYDCPIQDGIIEYCQRVAGGTIEAARMLNNGFCKTAIHWLGGWHHAKRSNAAGFCYVNDCVLGIIELRKKFERVLYIDLDLHHGDGVQDAFCGTNKVLTFSIHKFEPGFFPGTGSDKEIGYGKGKYYTVNVPLLDGARDDTFCDIFDKIAPTVLKKFKPGAILCQLGADGLNEDPMHSFNLTHKSQIHCIRKIQNWGIPLLILGGGGYNPANTARTWTSVTASLIGKEISEDIPEHEYFLEYGPHYELPVSQSLRKDLNTSKYIAEVVSTVENNLEQIN
ncbi:histone deacetylase 8-like isoform X1 [Styela clava]